MACVLTGILNDVFCLTTQYAFFDNQTIMAVIVIGLLAMLIYFFRIPGELALGLGVGIFYALALILEPNGQLFYLGLVVGLIALFALVVWRLIKFVRAM